MAKDLMRYDLLAQQALRGVVRASLEIAKKDGLPGDHHFYIAFATRAPGVQLSERLRAQHPEEMTIILQHQYWDLEVGPERFSLTLSFNNISETLVVPFAAVKGFYDPSVQFGLQFETGTAQSLGSFAPDAGQAEPAGTLSGPDAGQAVPREETANREAPAMEGHEAVGGGEVVSLDAFRKK